MFKNPKLGFILLLLFASLWDCTKEPNYVNCDVKIVQKMPATKIKNDEKFIGINSESWIIEIKVVFCDK